MVGGNVVAVVRRASRYKTSTGAYADSEPKTIMTIAGWIDYVAGQTGSGYKSQVEESTHVMVSDYDADYACLGEAGLTLAIDGRVYRVMLIDDPMGLHEHVETYLQYTGVET